MYTCYERLSKSLQSARFFRRSKDEKDELAWYSPEANRGYTAQGREKVTELVDKDAIDQLRASNPDLKESMEIGREDEPECPNMWPKQGEEGRTFKETMNLFFNICKEMHIQVMRSIGLGMGLEETFFDKYCDVGDNTLRLLHYPSCPKDVFVKNTGQVRAGQHTDYGE